MIDPIDTPIVEQKEHRGSGIMNCAMEEERKEWRRFYCANAELKDGSVLMPASKVIAAVKFEPDEDGLLAREILSGESRVATLQGAILFSVYTDDVLYGGTDVREWEASSFLALKRPWPAHAA